MVVATTFVLLFLAFGSVVLPVKAMVMNVLSLGASFGALVWIFQEGHLSGFLDFTPTGFVEATQPILVLAIVFGLSMDYEVFLMSRIREQYDLTGDNTAAVATGLQRTGGIITSAALLLLVVIGAFSLSGITFIKMIGVAMLIAIVIDATIVRILLVPATMRLLGRANWYAPGPLRRLYARYGIRESDGEPSPHAAADRGARRRPLTHDAPDFRVPGVRGLRRQTAAAAPSLRHPRAGTAWRRRSTGWVSSSRGGAGASRTRRGGSWDGGMQLAAADAVPAALLDGVAVRARRRHGASSNCPSPRSGPGRTMAGRDDGTGLFRSRGTSCNQTVTWPAAASSRRSRNGTCPLTSFVRASSRPNQAARSISGNSCIRPDRGGHSSSKVLLTRVRGVQIALGRPDGEHLAAGHPELAQRQELRRRARASRAPPRTRAGRRPTVPRRGRARPWGSTRRRRPSVAQNGPPMCPSSTSGPPSPRRHSRIPALVLAMSPSWGVYGHKRPCGAGTVATGQTRTVPSAPSDCQYSLSALLVRTNQMNGPTRMKIPGKNHSAVTAVTGGCAPRRE